MGCRSPRWPSLPCVRCSRRPRCYVGVGKSPPLPRRPPVGEGGEGRGPPAPRGWGPRACSFAYRGPRLPSLSRGRVPLGLAGPSGVGGDPVCAIWCLARSCACARWGRPRRVLRRGRDPSRFPSPAASGSLPAPDPGCGRRAACVCAGWGGAAVTPRGRPAVGVRRVSGSRSRRIPGCGPCPARGGVTRWRPEARRLVAWRGRLWWWGGGSRGRLRGLDRRSGRRRRRCGTALACGGGTPRVFLAARLCPRSLRFSLRVPAPSASGGPSISARLSLSSPPPILPW